MPIVIIRLTGPFIWTWIQSGVCFPCWDVQMFSAGPGSPFVLLEQWPERSIELAGGGSLTNVISDAPLCLPISLLSGPQCLIFFEQKTVRAIVVLVTAEYWGTLLHSVCGFLWYKYSHRGRFQTTVVIATGSQNSWKFNSQLSWASTSHFLHTTRS